MDELDKWTIEPWERGRGRGWTMTNLVLTCLVLVGGCADRPSARPPTSDGGGITDSASHDAGAIDGAIDAAIDPGDLEGTLSAQSTHMSVGLVGCLEVRLDQADGPRLTLPPGTPIEVSDPTGLTELTAAPFCHLGLGVLGVRAGETTVELRWGALRGSAEVRVTQDEVTLNTAFSRTTAIVGASGWVRAYATTSGWGYATGPVTLRLEPSGIELTATFDAPIGEFGATYFVPDQPGDYTVQATWNGQTAIGEDVLIVRDVGDDPPSYINAIRPTDDRSNRFNYRRVGRPLLSAMDLANTEDCIDVTVIGGWEIEGVPVSGPYEAASLAVQADSGDARIVGRRRLCGERAGAATLTATSGPLSAVVALSVGGNEVRSVEAMAELTRGTTGYCGEVTARVEVADGRMFTVGSDYLGLSATNGPLAPPGMIELRYLPPGVSVCINELENFTLRTTFAGSAVGSEIVFP